MNLLLRIFWIWLTQTRGQQAKPLDPTTIIVWTMLTDLDLNLHVNNGRYLTLADLGRMDWFVRTGCLRAARGRDWIPVIGDANARFIRQVGAFKRLRMETRLVGWNEKWAFLEHRMIEKSGKTACIVMVRGMFWSRSEGRVPPQVLLDATGNTGLVSPELPEWVRSWSLSLDQLSQAARAERTTGDSTSRLV
jgi:acyl-CoA thioesterase FadM